jgi:hypothetical protein
VKKAMEAAKPEQLTAGVATSRSPRSPDSSAQPLTYVPALSAIAIRKRNVSANELLKPNQSVNPNGSSPMLLDQTQLNYLIFI